MTFAPSIKYTTRHTYCIHGAVESSSKSKAFHKEILKRHTHETELVSNHFHLCTVRLSPWQWMIFMRFQADSFRQIFSDSGTTNSLAGANDKCSEHSRTHKNPLFSGLIKTWGNHFLLKISVRDITAWQSTLDGQSARRQNRSRTVAHAALNSKHFCRAAFDWFLLKTFILVPCTAYEHLKSYMFSEKTAWCNTNE